MNKDALNKILINKEHGFHVNRLEDLSRVNKDYIKQIRSKYKLSQLVFASILGVSVKTIEKWEQGSIEPRDLVKKFLIIINDHPDTIDYLYNIDYKKQDDFSYSTTSKFDFPANQVTKENIIPFSVNKNNNEKYSKPGTKYIRNECCSAT